MRKLLLMALVSLTLFSCSKNDKTDSGDNPRIVLIPGFGNSGGEIPGTAFSLPSGIQLQGSITGESMSPVCTTLGFGSLVDVYLELKNTTAAEIKVTFPAGLTLYAASASDQNGFVAQNYDVTIAAGAVCIVKLNAYCINSSRSGSSSSSRYTWGPVCNAPAIVYFLKLLKDKDLSKDEDSQVQPSLWMISDTETDPVSSKQIWDIVRENIAAIPNR
ncbi:hypothetical protein ACFS6H_03220 [Terrimonas rubra]|uniref:Lipoprotein n=1 Tax=Terrimonas rubra TaxID=1035890 RepID=A0ABW6A095_9BACT